MVLLFILNTALKQQNTVKKITDPNQAKIIQDKYLQTKNNIQLNKNYIKNQINNIAKFLETYENKKYIKKKDPIRNKFEELIEKYNKFKKLIL